MPTSAQPTSKQAFQDKIYSDLEQKLRQTPWNSGVSEAHGLLCGLACRGITGDTIRTRAFLFQLTDPTHVDLIEGVFSLASRDLEDEQFGFTLMLPGADTSLAERAESVSSWCQGFLQGIYSDDTAEKFHGSETITEALDDIMQIGHLELAPTQQGQSEQDLVEIEEFLRVAVQLIYDEMNPTRISPNTLNQ